VDQSIVLIQHLENCGMQKYVRVGGRSSGRIRLARQLLALESIDWGAKMGWLIFPHSEQQA